ncbi:hypothetical protein LCM19_08840 [Qipengyuania flava]|nr:hypothetical protein [Qipengyuania flava]
MILLIDLNADFRMALESIIARNGGLTASLSTQDILGSRLLIDCRNDCGSMQLPDGREIALEQVRGSIASPVCLEGLGTDLEESEFIYSEAVGLLAYLRERTKPALNPPFAGSHVTNCGSLPEQWETVKRCNIDGVITPEWTLRPSGTSESTRLEIVNPFDLPIRLKSDDAIQGRLRLSATKPRGAIASCAFHRETLHLLVLKDGGWREMPMPDRTASRLRSIVRLFKSSCGLDFGQVHFSFLSDLLFWSIMPSISDEHIRSPGCRPVLAQIAGDLA